MAPSERAQPPAKEKAEMPEQPGKPEKAEKAAVARLRQRDDVEKALEQTAPGEQDRRPDSRRPKTLLIVEAVVAAALGTLAYLVETERLRLPVSPFGIWQRVPLALFLISAALLVERLTETFLVRRISSRSSRYNLTRVLRLVVGVLLLGIVGSVVFANLYTGLVSLGVISLIVGLAVQTPMTSFIGWLYILVRAPYRVGDRIQIDGATGDVIEVSYLDTTLWEFGGKYLSTDHPSGRIIKFPNSKALSTTVYNYSWPLFPYIWNEVRFQIAYQSDLEFVGRIMQQVAEEELGPEMMKHVRVYRDLLAQTPVDQLTVQEKPVVVFRVSDNTWIEAIVRYLVDPKRAGRVKTELVKKLLAKLNAAPDKVMFPKADNR
jgi:small-conductance mechanosensitive channel